MEIKDKEIRGLGDIETIIQDMESLYFGSGGHLPLWYRGEADSEWNLHPGVYRPRFRKLVDSAAFTLVAPNLGEDISKEITINKTFRQRGSSLLYRPDDLASVYFQAQHYQLPTRLLDWSENLLVALFFVVSDETKFDKDGAVYALNPRTVLPKNSEPAVSTYPRDIVEQSHPEVTKALDALFGRGAKPRPAYVIPIAPTWDDARMLQQSSFFTLHMPDAQPLENCAGMLYKYIVPKDAKKDLFFLLRRMGIHWASLFPDLDHLAYEMKAAHGLTATDSEDSA